MSRVQFVRGDTRYYMNEKGELTYTSPSHDLLTPSGDWRVEGALEFGRGYTGGHVVRRYTLADILANRVPWFYKNGVQRCYVKDYDHGHYRVWMSPTLKDVWLEGVGYVQGGMMNPFRRTRGQTCGVPAD